MQKAFPANLNIPPAEVISALEISLPSIGEKKKGIRGEERKRVLDITLSALIFLLILPLLLTVIAIVLASQGRPIFIRHKRVGRNGSTFECLKFRTMSTNGDHILAAHLAANPAALAEWEATRKLKDDPRVTPLGHVLRKSSVDEIPQLINVLRGEMSLVGPRPIVQAEVVRYGAQYELYKRVRPGITGAWQISGRNDISYANRVEMDADYIQNWSLTGDIAILARTLPAVLSASGSY